MTQPLSSNLPWELANNIWAQSLNPILANPILAGKMIQKISLVASVPKIINHGLNRMQTGWFLTDQNAASSVFRAADFNTQTLTLEATANVTVSLWVF